METSLLLGCILFAVVIVGVGLVLSMGRIVPQYQRIVVFRFGSCIGQKGPGIVFLYPFGIDRAITVDLREEVREVPHQTNITKDNASIGIDFLIYWLVFTHEDSVANFLSGPFHQQYKWLTSVALALFVPAIAYIYGKVSELALKIINID